MLIVTRPDVAGQIQAVNANLAERIFTAIEENEDEVSCQVLAETSTSNILLGTYDTIERCTEVLMEIIKEYESYHVVPHQNTMMRPWAFDPPKVYRMPED